MRWLAATDRLATWHSMAPQSIGSHIEGALCAKLVSLFRSSCWADLPSVHSCCFGGAAIPLLDHGLVDTVPLPQQQENSGTGHQLSLCCRARWRVGFRFRPGEIPRPTLRRRGTTPSGAGGRCSGHSQLRGPSRVAGFPLVGFAAVRAASTSLRGRSRVAI
jgi:hypothetical protein